jgi:uncharacterized protein
MIPVCPKCHVNLIVLRFQEVEVDLCQKCQGIWLDDGELQSLTNQQTGDLQNPLLQFKNAEGSPTRNSLCPRCDSPMDEIHSREMKLTLERCASGHGLWFDSNELQQLLNHFASEKDTHSTVKYLHDVFGSKTELKH